MTASQTGRCPTCGGALHGVSPCPPRRRHEIELLAGGPCNCLPAPGDDWPACASCGLRQAPGKAFCGYCGSRWVTAGEGIPDARR